jgi:hypothetical protein
VCEFDQKDKDARKAANKKMALELLIHKAKSRLERESESTLKDYAATELEYPVPVQITSLMTLDKMRTKLFKGCNGHNERQQFIEEAEAFESLEGHVETIAINGREVKVKFDIRLWNFGVNKLAFGDQSIFLPKMGRDFEDKYNKKAMEKLSGKVKKSLEYKCDTRENHRNDLNRTIKDKELQVKVEKMRVYELTMKNYKKNGYKCSYNWVKNKFDKLKAELDPQLSAIEDAIANMDQLLKKKHTLRAEIDALLKRGKQTDLTTRKKIQEYTEAATELSIAIEQNKHLHYAKVLEEEEDIRDLYTDVKELYESKMYKSVDKMFGNRYALVAALQLLSNEINENPHYHCKSGRDRTAGTDIEVKVKCEMKRRKGRFPSYFEHGSDEENLVRREIRLKSGNIDKAAKRTFGGPGLKNKNCAIPDDKDPVISKRIKLIERGVMSCYLKKVPFSFYRNLLRPIGRFFARLCKSLKRKKTVVSDAVKPGRKGCEQLSELSYTRADKASFTPMPIMTSEEFEKSKAKRRVKTSDFVAPGVALEKGGFHPEPVKTVEEMLKDSGFQPMPIVRLEEFGRTAEVA